MATKRIWDNYIELGEVQKSEGMKFVVAAATRNGFRYINIREFYMRKSDGVWKPGLAGIAVPLVVPTTTQGLCTPLADLIEILTENVSTVKEMELLNEDNAVYSEDKK